MLSVFFFFLRIRRPPRSTLFPTRRSSDLRPRACGKLPLGRSWPCCRGIRIWSIPQLSAQTVSGWSRSEEHTSELQSRQYLVCRLLLEKKKNLLSPPNSQIYAHHYHTLSKT